MLASYMILSGAGVCISKLIDFIKRKIGKNNPPAELPEIAPTEHVE